MVTKTMWTLTVLALAAAVGAPMMAVAEDDVVIEPSSMPIGNATEYIGEWVLSLNFQGRNVHLILKFSEVDGMLAATLSSPIQVQPQVITDITAISRGLKLRYAAQFGETETGMTLTVRRERGKLSGTIADDLGFFKGDISGTRGGKIPGRALVDLSGKQIKITFKDLKLGSKDGEAFANLKDGEVYEFTSSRATKLFTDSDLLFGDTVIRTENAAKNYPGVYSLWLKKEAGQWFLVFNSDADIWGTMHESKADVAQIPLTVSKLTKTADKFEISLTGETDHGQIRLAWGDTQWSTDFSLQ